MDNNSGLYQDDEAIFFAEEVSKDQLHSTAQWKILIVDDEKEVHSITQFALHNYQFQNHSLSILNAYSTAEAKNILQQHTNIAIILLDMVMETDHAGLNLVKYIREELQNHLIRIVLRTEQAPEREVIIEYDINDYKHKTELTDDKLFTLVTANLRSYINLTTIESYRTDLEKKVEQRSQEIAEKNQSLLESNQILHQLNQEKMEDKSWCEAQVGGSSCFHAQLPLAHQATQDTKQSKYIASPLNHAELLQCSLQTMRETESRLIQFLDAMPVGVVVVDYKGALYYINQKAQTLLGKGIVPHTTYENFAEIYQLYHAGSKKLYCSSHSPITQALEGHSTSVDDIEIHREGKMIPLEVWATPIYDEKQYISYAISIFNDITEQKKSDSEREKFTSELVQLKKSYERFVPREFLNLLDKQHMIDVQLGDQVAKEMTVMFSDIRGFTSLSEDMEPQEIFDFINNYLGQMEPIILKHHGFIDKYIGDAIMALFSTTVDDAVRGSISMLQTLEQYNNLLQRAGYPPIKIGIGLNTGPLILGTVGGQNRMDGTVISDAVNIAARIENLTKKYGTPLLITAESYIKLKNIMEYHIRVIDSVKVKGKSKNIVVYEIFDADPPAMIELKLQTLRDFEQGFMCYHNNNISQARTFFEKVNEINPTDQATQVYLKRCIKHHYL